PRVRGWPPRSISTRRASGSAGWPAPSPPTAPSSGRRAPAQPRRAADDAVFQRTKAMNRELPNQPAPASPESVQMWDREHFLHPWEGMGPDQPDRMIAAEGEGIYLIDSKGRRFIDGPGG